MTTTLDRAAFEQTLPLIALTIPTKLCSTYLQKFEPFLFSRPRVKRIYDPLPPTPPPSDLNQPQSLSPAIKLVLLAPTIQQYPSPSEQEEEKSSLPAELVQFHEEQCQHHQIPPPYHTLYPFTLTYDHYTAEEVLHRLLSPAIESSEIPSSFETIGHIAHMNLRDEVLPFKHIIGQVILDKNPILKIVVNKIGNIETQFRTFPLEVIARRSIDPATTATTASSPLPLPQDPINATTNEEEFVVQVKESNAIFRFNFAEVYWNSRLQYEHQRIIDIIRDTVSSNSLSSSASKRWIVADMMAGVGPFAVPLAMTSFNHTNNPHSSSAGNANPARGKVAASTKRVYPITVHANDLNPVSYKYLLQNRDLNKCSSTLTPYNLDGREFMSRLVKEQHVYPNEVIMNLPAIATEFLDVFIGLYSHLNTASTASSSPLRPPAMPRIHVYAFSTNPTDPIQDIVERAAGILHCPSQLLMESEGYHGHIVRDVAPKKVMVCLSFTLPLEVAMGDPRSSLSLPTPSKEILSNESHLSRKRSREAEDEV